jgi:hypothetical protein
VQHSQLVGIGVILWGVKMLYDATAGNRRQRVVLARNLRTQQWREQRRKRILVRRIRRMLWWLRLSAAGRMLTAASGIVACLVGTLLIAL